jgi:hypothetical protein
MTIGNITIRFVRSGFGFRSYGAVPYDGPNRGRIFRFRFHLGPWVVCGYDAE